MEQTKLLSSGVQLWNKNIIACRSTSDDEEVGSNILSSRMAFCSSLAVFVFDVNRGIPTTILAGYEGLLSALSWSLFDENQLATASHDGRLVLWDLKLEKRMVVLALKQAPVAMAWFPYKSSIHGNGCEYLGRSTVIVLTSRGSIIVWNASGKKHKVILGRSIKSGLNKTETKRLKESLSPTVIRCNSQGSHSLCAIGYKDGRVELVDLVYSLENKAKMSSFYIAKDEKSLTSNHNESGISDNVSDLQWDPFSTNYLLVAYSKSGIIVLFDCEQFSNIKLVQKFKLSSYNGKKNQNILSIAWQCWAPGNFMSVSEKGSGIIQVWNVSQPNPIELVQFTDSNSSACAMEVYGSLCVLSLENGGVCAYNAKRKLQLFQTTPSHRETVFDLKFDPDSGTRFASCSFDGKVKVWDTDTLTCLQTLKHEEKPILYGLSWAPDGMEKIASCTYLGELCIWDVSNKNGTLLQSYKAHKGPIYRVEWNQNDSSLIATASGDKNVKIFTYKHPTKSIEESMTLPHPDKAFGCAWDPFYHQDGKEYLATTCQDAKVRIWDFAIQTKKKAKLVYVLEGHQKKIFNVVWSPLKNKLLASGSDDHQINLWNLSSSNNQEEPKLKPSMTLYGHTSNVRALVFHPEIPNLLLSGSWDGTIRMWNVDLGSQMFSIQDHHADVYGLAIHPLRPFMVASSSRDTTIRFWEMQNGPPISTNGLKTKSIIQFVLGGKDQEKRMKMDTLNSWGDTFHGSEGKNLFDQLKCHINNNNNNNNDTDGDLDLIEKLFDFFGDPGTLNDFWGLVRKQKSRKTLKIHDCSTLLERHEKKLSYQKLKYDKSTCENKQQLDKLVLEYCKLGDFLSACELLKNNGQWERALSLAPTISLEYWKTLNLQYGSTLISKHDEHAVIHCLVGGNPLQAIEFYKARAQYEQAFLISQVNAEEKYHEKNIINETKSSRPNHEKYNKLIRYQIARINALHELELGHGILASCHLLSIGDVNGAIFVLLFCEEQELAFVLYHIYKSKFSSSLYQLLLKKLADKCERFGDVQLGLNLLQRTVDAKREGFLLSARMSLNDSMRQKLGMRQKHQLLNHAEELKRKLSDDDGGSIEEILVYLVASGEREAQLEAIELGMEKISKLLSATRWDLNQVQKLFKVIQSIDLLSIYGTTSEEDKAQIYNVLAFSCFFAILQATFRQLDNIILPLYDNLDKLLLEHPISFPVSLCEIYLRQVRYILGMIQRADDYETKSVLLLRAKTVLKKASALKDTNTDNQKKKIEQLENIVLYKSENLITSSIKTYHKLANINMYTRALPNGNLRLGKKSLFDNNQIIKGPAVTLKSRFGSQRKSYLSKFDAYVWYSVNPYAPVNDGSFLFKSQGTSSSFAINKKTDGNSSSSAIHDNTKNASSVVDFANRIESNLYKK